MRCIGVLVRPLVGVRSVVVLVCVRVGKVGVGVQVVVVPSVGVGTCNVPVGVGVVPVVKVSGVRVRSVGMVGVSVVNVT